MRELRMKKDFDEEKGVAGRMGNGNDSGCGVVGESKWTLQRFGGGNPIVWSHHEETMIAHCFLQIKRRFALSQFHFQHCGARKNNVIHYYSVIKDSLVADVSREQLIDKRVFELSKQIWDECVSDSKSEEKKRKKVMVNDKIDDTVDDDDNNNKKKKNKKRKIINKNESESESGNAFTKLFHEYCEEKRLEVKWLEKEERDSLGNLWKQASQLEWEQGILESQYKKL
ncbi:hypothetical protein FEM48_Zijuj08G0204700 [Ziziphus jujuba var. spinosa]|uniref:Uncharacterized protein n=1 Tax=Ziziphus jujuba var. spinosa TaxID=714518 RepID=A0A978V180_ZIZJJ|nr:hypothetical protein FEM48_Zijuj08G0204700 [Ziziphus jujuba var. spinosa]